MGEHTVTAQEATETGRASSGGSIRFGEGWATHRPRHKRLNGTAATRQRMRPPDDRSVGVDDLEHRSAGEDDEDPYEDVDLSELPEWWRKAIREHRTFDLRPYRPPRFQDGEIYPELKNELEGTLDVEIRLACFDVEGGVWDIVVDGETVAKTERWRSPEGYSVIDMASEDFRQVVVDGP